MIVQYLDDVKAAREAGKPKPQIPNKIVRCFYQIANGLSSKPNYFGYAFKEDMVQDAVMTMCQYVETFDPARSSNPFAYFTQSATYAFWRRINIEKKHLYTVYKLIEDTELFSHCSDSQSADSAEADNTLIGYSEHARGNMQNFMQQYERWMESKKKTKETTDG